MVQAACRYLLSTQYKTASSQYTDVECKYGEPENLIQNGFYDEMFQILKKIVCFTQKVFEKNCKIRLALLT